MTRVIPLALAAGLLLVGGEGRPQPPRAALESEGCASLSSFSLAPAKLDLPTRGMRVVEAKGVAAQSGAIPNPAYCRVTGEIAPLDPTAPAIRFSVALPANWNGKAVMLGGGGYDGVIPDPAGLLLNEPVAIAQTPLLRGYAVFSSDSGHQAKPGAAPIPAVDGAFLTNDEALRNFAGDALKKTRDASVAIIRVAYGRAPERTYFAGGSNGGREALTVIQRWPQDFDGVIAAYPFWNAGTTTLAFGAIMNGFARPGAYLPPAGQALLYRTVIKACDSLDGVSDSVISNGSACRFDPATLACRPGQAADECLSPPQIAALRRYASPTRFAYRRGIGETWYPGYPIFSGADLRGAQQMGSAAPAFPPVKAMPVIAHFWDQFARLAVARDPALDPTRVDPERPGGLRSRINTVVGMLDSRSVALRPFAARGGRLIIYQGLADAIVSPASTALYWSRLRAALGASEVDSFARFYTIPGYGHGPGGLSAFEPGWDPLAVIDDWRESGRSPGTLTVKDMGAGRDGRTRPLCRFGTWPRFVNGPQTEAASFRCVTR